jgi:hypothetical protein
MRVKLLKYAVAPDAPPPLLVRGEHPAWDDPATVVPSPTWDEVESAVRRLDGLRYRWLFLWPTTDPADHDPSPGSREYMEIIGGNGIYNLRVSFDDGRFGSLHFPEWPDRDVVVLPDPSGFGFVDGVWAESARRVCRDVEVVLRAARHYYDTGSLDQSLPWQVRRDNTIHIPWKPEQGEPST